ncbi:hypothetical protein M409DRAFT_64336 [Zasmidium cellare ATCC 36951]|uniref:Major facilitator superfamily (MFS) profile domain-containing protein n=1 Tax=Zasmidium cellare ATCC 36951 TaxID=1080233 RepID=A0A6A6CZB3_ZASCE|nr:uncharacterized protein M409DRAFT_64336 [Zasmidium cellare ATCC 36951]KAF2170706.1 hypothetical protein M409DRAFT_64336 [Zasmidium cellare ATCC 36951]
MATITEEITTSEEITVVGKTDRASKFQRPQFGEASSKEEYPHGPKLWLTVLTISAVLILGALDINIVATAVPSITNEFHTSADVGWYSSAFRLTTCAFQFMFGKLYKFFRVKKVFMASNAAFLFSSIICATATSSAMFIVGRAISGVGFAGILSGLNAFHVFPPRRRPMFIGFMCALESVAIVSAPIVGGALTQSLGWRWCFWINLPVAGVALLISFFCLQDPILVREDLELPLKEKIFQLDLVSNAVFIPGLTCLFIALSWAGVKYPWSDGRVVGLLVTFGVCMTAFLYNQHRRGDRAALPLRLFKHRSIIGGFIFSSGVNSVLNVFSYYLPTYYQVVRDYAPAKAGFMMIPITVGDSIGAVLLGLGTSLWGYYTPFMLVASIGMPIFAGLISTFDPATISAKLILYSGAVGLTTGIGYMGPNHATRTVLKPEDASLGTSIILFGGNFGPALFIAVAQVIFSNQLSANLKVSMPGTTAPGLDSSGLHGILDSLPPAQRADAVAAVSKSLSQTWYLAVALGGATLIGSALMEWRSVKQKKA